MLPVLGSPLSTNLALFLPTNLSSSFLCLVSLFCSVLCIPQLVSDILKWSAVTKLLFFSRQLPNGGHAFLSFYLPPHHWYTTVKHMEASSMFELFHFTICFHRHRCWTESKSFPRTSDEMTATPVRTCVTALLSLITVTLNSNSGLLYWSWKYSILHLEENKTSQYSFQMLYCPLENINAGILAWFT